MKQWKETYENLMWITQLGLNLVMPILMCVLICWWLTEHHGMGEWGYIPGFFLGFGASIMSAYKMYQDVSEKERKKEKNKKRFFNRHL